MSIKSEKGRFTKGRKKEAEEAIREDKKEAMSESRSKESEGRKTGQGKQRERAEGRNLMTGEGMMKLIMQLGRTELYKSGNFARHLRGQR